MPLAAPIGSNRGLCTKAFIDIVLKSTDLPVIVDAASANRRKACEAMENGCHAIMCNTAIATAGNVAQMCKLSPRHRSQSPGVPWPNGPRYCGPSGSIQPTHGLLERLNTYTRNDYVRIFKTSSSDIDHRITFLMRN